MTRFYPFDHLGSQVQLRPVGLRKYRPLYSLPYRTGDELILGLKPVEKAKKLKTTEKGEKVVTPEMIWSLFLISPPDSEERQVAGTVTTHKDLGLPISFGRMPLSGEYQVYVEYGRQEPPERLNIGTIQVEKDYLVLSKPLSAGVGLVLGSALTILIQWAVRHI